MLYHEPLYHVLAYYSGVWIYSTVVIYNYVSNELISYVQIIDLYVQCALHQL